MFRNKRMVLAGILSICVFFAFAQSGYCVTKPDTENVRQISGEIVWIDLQQGTLKLRQGEHRGWDKVTEYRINAHDTFVTDPASKEFLTLNDLRVGQDVTLELPAVRDWKIVSKIIAQPLPVFVVVTGDVVAMDTRTGTMTLQVVGNNGASYFVFEPDDIFYMKSTGKEPVHLEVKPGDRVRVEYLSDSGKQRARYITLMPASGAGSTTTTTTTTVTNK